MTRDEIIQACVDLPYEEWRSVMREVNRKHGQRHVAARDAQADQLAQILDMTPEGYVREWVMRGRINKAPLDAWEWAYQRAGIIDQAWRRGYLEIGRDVACSITLTDKGEKIARNAHSG